MPAKNFTVFTVVCAILLSAMFVGVFRTVPLNEDAAAVSKQPSEKKIDVPCIGKIQVLNGYGGDGAADDVVDFLRARKFDVKEKGNAMSFNYPFTLVVSRTKDMTIAGQVAGALKTDHLVLVRNEDLAYDATVIIGGDYKERIR
jgi:hypothetical protein